MPGRSSRCVLDADAVAVAVPDGPVVPRPARRDLGRHAARRRDAWPRSRRCCPRPHDPLVRASIWCSVRNAFQHALLGPDAVLDLVEVALPAEDTDDGVGQTLGWAVWNVAPGRRRPGRRPRPPARRGRALRRRRPSPAAASSSPRSRSRSPPADDEAMLRDWLTSAATRSPTASSSTSTCAGGSCCGWPSSAPSTATSSPPRWREETDRGVAGRAREGAGRAARRRGQGLGVAAVHRRGRGAQLRARGDRPRLLAGRSGASSPTRTSPGTSTSCSPPPRCAAARCWRVATHVFYPRWSATRGHRRPGARPARPRRRRLDDPPRARRRDLGPRASARGPPGVRRGMTDRAPGRAVPARRCGPGSPSTVGDTGDEGAARGPAGHRGAARDPASAWPGSAAQRVWVTMRTPGHDFELAAGFSCHEAIATPSCDRAGSPTAPTSTSPRSRSSTS